MRKSWADVSSDEDSDFESEKTPIVEEPDVQPPIADDEPDEEIVEVEEPPRRKKEYELPDGPPFTAFVGNLPFSIVEPDELGQRIAALMKERFEKDVKVVRSRVAIDRRDRKHKGFGYVEVETLDDLQAVLELDDGKSIIAGRPIHLDVAQPHAAGGNSNNNNSNRNVNKSKSFGDVDGSSFRSGRYSKQRSTSFRRQNSNSSEGGGQRPSLKLQPRTKTGESEGKNGDDNPSNSSSIFGGGKARDETSWRRSTSEGKAPGEKRPPRANRTTSGGGGGRGGGGRGGGGGGGGGKNNSFRRQSSTGSRGGAPKKEETKKPEVAKQEAPTTSPPNPTNPSAAPKKVINKFAALDFGDSDSD